MRTTAAVALFSCLSLGCTTGFDRKPDVARMQDSSITVSDADVAFAQSVKPQLKFPCRIAVYFTSHNSNYWRWTAKDKAAFESCGEALVREGIASDVFVMSSMFVGEEDAQTLNMKAIRVAAAKHGADALFVVQGKSDATISKNPAALLNLTIVGGFLVPGSQCDALFVMQGGLIDVNNGCLYASVESEGSARVYRPSFVIEKDAAVAKAKAEAVKYFGTEVVTRIRSMRDSMTQVAAPANGNGIGPVQEIDPKTGQPLSK